MEFLKACWALNFFFAGLILFLIWSKMLVINKRLSGIRALLQELQEVESSSHPAATPVNR